MKWPLLPHLLLLMSPLHWPNHAKHIPSIGSSLFLECSSSTFPRNLPQLISFKSLLKSRFLREAFPDHPMALELPCTPILYTLLFFSSIALTWYNIRYNTLLTMCYLIYLTISILCVPFYSLLYPPWFEQCLVHSRSSKYLLNE